MKLDANGIEIRVMGDVLNENAYIFLTDIAKYKNPDNAFIVVANWMRNTFLIWPSLERRWLNGEMKRV